MSSSILLQAQASGQLDYFDLAAKGGIIMYPLLLLSLIAVYIFVERFLSIQKARKIDQHFMHNIRQYILENKIDAALALCQSQYTPLSRMIEKGIRRMNRPLNDIQASIENVGNLEVAKLETNLPMLATIAGGAPMIGFLGTVTGMIRAFFDMSNAETLDVKLLSGGIYEAMVTTVAGLVVGILAYFGYNFLVARIEKVVAVLEASTAEFMDLLHLK